jgi:DNA repair photolyase
MEAFVRKGRGAPSNDVGRFEKQKIEYERTDDDIDAPGPRTTFYQDSTKTILSKNDSPDLGFSFGINPYRGCEHGCIYCYARPTHEYLGFSAGVDFETKILVKKNAPALLRKELMVKSFAPQTIIVSGNTDCYQPAERKFGLTRACLEVLSQFRNPFAIITKNHLVTRDIDIIAPMSKLNVAMVCISVTTLDAELSGLMEPRASRPELRLKAIRELSEAGIRVGVNVAPVIPGLTDHEMPQIMEEARKAGATSAGFTVVRLPHSVKNLFQQWLDLHYPNKKNKIINRIRDMRGGKLYSAEFGSRMKGEGEFADLIRGMFDRYYKEFGYGESWSQLSAEHFQRPGEQLMLL